MSLADEQGKEKLPSEWRAGKRSEIDYLNRLIVRRGAAQGIATLANQVLWRW